MEILDQQAAQTAADRVREQREARRRARGRVPGWAVAVLALVAVWLWVFPPPFLREAAVEPPPATQEEAALRLAMYVQAQRIKAYRQAEGRLPASLEEVGPPLPGMAYVRLAPGLYQLTGATDRLTLTYRSDLPLGEFVGPGADVLDEAKLP